MISTRSPLGEMQSLPYLKAFYFGGKDKAGLKRLVSATPTRARRALPMGKDSHGQTVNVRIGSYGPYLERGEDRANIPVGTAPDELTMPRAEQLLEQAAAGPKQLGNDPATGKPIYVKVGRFGPYVQLGDPTEDEKPKMKSLLPGMTPETPTHEQALSLLSLPRSPRSRCGDRQGGLRGLRRYGPRQARRRFPQPRKTDDVLR
jgi:DNA topoisomerase-1